MTATTALTAQNTQGVIDIHVTPSSFVTKQIDACIDDVGVDVVKTGALAELVSLHLILLTRVKGCLRLQRQSKRWRLL